MAEIVKKGKEELDIKRLREQVLDNAIINIISSGVELVFLNNKEEYERLSKQEYQKKVYMYTDGDGYAHPKWAILKFVDDPKLLEKYCKLNGIDLPVTS